MDAEQKQKLADLCAQQHVAVLTTQGEAWPTAHLQACGQTDELDLIFIMLADAEKYSNLLTRPRRRLRLIIETRPMLQPASSARDDTGARHGGRSGQRRMGRIKRAF